MVLIPLVPGMPAVAILIMVLFAVGPLADSDGRTFV